MISRICILFLLSVFSLSILAQQRTIFVIGDNINLRNDTTLTNRSLYQVDWGTKFQGDRISQNWYFIDMPYDGPMYISSKYAVEESVFLKKAEEKEYKNGKTKFELMLLYIDNNQFEKAKNLLFDILNNNSRELYMQEGHEMCVLLGPYSYKMMLESNAGTVDYKDNNTLALAVRVYENTPDSIIRAIALTDQAKYYLYNQNLKKAEEILFIIIEEYASDLFIPVPCDYDFEGKIYPEINLLNAFNLLFQQLDNKEQTGLLNNLKEVSLNSKNLKSKEIIDKIILDLNKTHQTETIK